ncbi:MAG TPA: phosphopantetheine-binding protein, partial [Thermoanaerobaculia bacterium]|nr:phosphopantetheine-binding protein [Thermoanaerobaculia bacterium]
LYVTDFRGEPVPVGVPGELWIGGEGLARGYLGRPDLTAERFRPDPLSGQGGARLYQTGDLARWRPSGDLELLGRLDHQVKIRGFRIELGEIEAVLAAHPAVRECAVVVREDLPGTKRLAAYLVPQEGFVGSDSVFLETLREALPEYMVPQLFVMLPALPLTPNGKIDRWALLSGPAPETERDGDGPVRPRNRIEEILAAVWTETLQLDRIGIDDNFFALGGDSVMVIQVASRCRKRGLRFQPRHLFQNQTIASLAPVVDASDLIRAASAMVADPAVVGPVEFALAGLSHSDLQDLLEQLAG